jgi:phage repressor protein C with HTH and peptisase S24 domain
MIQTARRKQKRLNFAHLAHDKGPQKSDTGGMLRHKDIWSGIDRLAENAGTSPSGLARRAGLDPTSFNISKRINPQGKPRWPTTESVAKILHTTETTLADFVTLIGPNAGASHGRSYPVIGLAKAGKSGFFDDAGFPAGSGWRDIEGPDIGDESAYALEITGNSMRPAFRPSDVVIVSPGATIRRGDRVVVKTIEGEVMAKEIVRLTKRQLELRSVNAEHPDPVIATQDIAWMHRIVWTSQ